jgi:hypothetical protein
MLVYTPFALCFVYTSWCFYAFSRTNLLTRCHSASSCFLLFLCFKNVTQEIFLKLDQTKAKVPNYMTWRRSPKESQRWTKGQPHHVVARATPRPRHQVVRPPGPPPDIALPPIYSPRRENPKARTLFQKRYRKPPPSSVRDREGLEALLGTLLERGITPGGLICLKRIYNFLMLHACLCTICFVFCLHFLAFLWIFWN